MSGSWNERWARWSPRLWDPLIALGLFGGYLAALLGSVRNLGYARDEGFYYHAARTYGEWFSLLGSDPAQAFRRAEIDRIWQENHEHPALMKSLFWFSQHWLSGSVFHERGTATRFPTMLLAALAVAVIFWWGRRSCGRAGGVVAALAFACMPRVFYHSHLCCFDLPIAAFWLFVAYAYYRSVETRSAWWALGAALLFGLALETKHNAYIIPPALCLHVLVCHVLERRLPGLPSRRWYRIRIPLVLPLMALIGPLVFYALWPWIWRQTWERWVEYIQFHLQHVYYNMEFLGVTYFKPPFPRSYTWLMTFGTVPAITLLLASGGWVASVRRYWDRSGGIWPWRRLPIEASKMAPAALARAETIESVLWAICIFASYAPWLSTSRPIFGGTKHWMTAYPFVALFAGRGFAWLSGAARECWPQLGPVRQRLLDAALVISVLIAPLVMTWHSNPWGLSAYTPLVGGAPGAATLGLNRTFWGYTTGAVQDFLNDEAPERARVFIHDTAMDSFKLLQKDHRLRSDLRPWWTVSGSDFALYQHEQHMSRVEHMIWTDYHTTSPLHVGAFDGVPVIWIYERPSYRARSSQ